MERKNTMESSDILLEKILDITGELYRKTCLRAPGEIPDHAQLYNAFAELGKLLVNADRVSFWQWDRPNHRLVTEAATGTDRIEIDEGTGLVGRALMENRALVTNDPYSHPDFNSSVDEKTGYRTRSVLVMPVSGSRGEVIGAFQAVNCLDEERGFSEEEDCRRLSLAAIICGITLESDLFRSESRTDKLTKLRNRMGFREDYASVLETVAGSEEGEMPVSIMICDIDFFKRVNDTYGHNAGDAVLEHVAKQLLKCVRDSDWLYRWGGEEFVAILPGADTDRAAMVAERIRKRIEENDCTYEGQTLHVTMSFGVTQIDPSLDPEENVDVADKRLYIAKKSGRNRVVKEG